MKTGGYIRFWGGLDLFAILWFVIVDIYNSRVPLYDQALNALRGAESFGLEGAYIMTVIALALLLSKLISGVLMIQQRKYGVYLSLIQMPFRLLFVIPPTFFFLSKIHGFLSLPVWVLVLTLYSGELVKLYTQIQWLRSR